MTQICQFTLCNAMVTSALLTQLLILQVLYISLFLLAQNETEKLMDVSPHYFTSLLFNIFLVYLVSESFLLSGFKGFYNRGFTRVCPGCFKFVWMGNQATCEYHPGTNQHLYYFGTNLCHVILWTTKKIVDAEILILVYL